MPMKMERKTDNQEDLHISPTHRSILHQLYHLAMQAYDHPHLQYLMHYMIL